MSHRLLGDSDEDRQREHIERLEQRIAELEDVARRFAALFTWLLSRSLPTTPSGRVVEVVGVTGDGLVVTADFAHPDEHAIRRHRAVEPDAVFGDRYSEEWWR